MYKSTGSFTMLYKTFSKAGRRGPLVLVHLGNDDPTRGDSQGFKGLGLKVAEKLNGSVLVTDDQGLAHAYPKKYNPTERLFAHLDYVGLHSHVFSRHGARIIIDEINERVTCQYANSNDLVTHHITPQTLKTEGRKFRDAYPGLPHPLIAVMTSTLSEIWVDDIVNGLQQACDDLSKATIFVCTSRRTRDSAYQELRHKLARAFDKSNIRLAGFHLNKSRGEDLSTESKKFNPYVGLIDQADHVIVVGDSYSMISEPLAAGKTVHTFRGCHFPTLEKKGFVRPAFQESCCRNFRLNTKNFAPINLTDQVAEKICSRYRYGPLWGLRHPVTFARYFLN